MAYYTGQVNNYTDMLTALQNACVTEGWVLEGTILSKGNSYFDITYLVGDANTPPSLMVRGGTGKNLGALTGPSDVTPRMGRGHKNAAADAWPMTYHIMIHPNPDEVYMFVNWSVDFYRWLAFGQSDQPGLLGTGAWLSANAMYKYNAGYGESVSYSYNMGDDFGGSGPGYYSYYRNTGLFWRTVSRYNSGTTASYAQYYQDTVNTGLNALAANDWAGVPTAAGSKSPGNLDAIRFNRPHMSMQPNVWNGDSILMPIQVHEWVASNKACLVLECRHSRYVRLDNYQPGDIITLGPDKWRVFPFWRKDVTERDVGNNKEHTGTFGLAVRYDGP